MEKGEILESSFKVLEKLIDEMVVYIVAKKACNVKTNLVKQEVYN
jgi:hypothetical protein